MIIIYGAKILDNQKLHVAARDRAPLHGMRWRLSRDLRYFNCCRRHVVDTYVIYSKPNITFLGCGRTNRTIPKPTQ